VAAPSLALPSSGYLAQLDSAITKGRGQQKGKQKPEPEQDVEREDKNEVEKAYMMNERKKERRGRGIRRTGLAAREASGETVGYVVQCRCRLMLIAHMECGSVVKEAVSATNGAGRCKLLASSLHSQVLAWDVFEKDPTVSHRNFNHALVPM
jgi:hypothetical protein